MTTKQSELEQVATERDAALAHAAETEASLGRAEVERDAALGQLAAFQQAAQEQAERLKAACPPPEAGVSVNVAFSATTAGITITGGQLTLRAPDQADAGLVLAMLKGIIEERGWKFAPAPAQAPPPAPNRAAAVARSEGNEPMARGIEQAAAAVPAPPAGKEWQMVDTQEIHITPQVDGLVKVEFWNPGRKWAEEYAKWKPDAVAGLLKHVTDADVNKAQKLACACRVYFLLGKEKNNKPGEYWHDIYHVRPL